MAEITNPTGPISAGEQEVKQDITESNNPSVKQEDFVLPDYVKPEVIIVSKPKGNPLWIKGKSANPNGRPKGRIFSIREDLIKSLKRIKKSKPELYQEIIDSYWSDGKMRQFLLEIVDGKARQSIEMAGTLENPVRIIEVKSAEEPKNEANVSL